MRTRLYKPKPGQVGNYWLTKKPGREGAADAWCRTWYDKRSRQTCRISLGTADIHEASLLLAGWVAENDKIDSESSQDRVLIGTVLLTYWNEHAKKLPSASTAFNGLCHWQEFWKQATVSGITPNEQRRFRQWLAAKGLDDGGIDRVLSDGKAALNRAVKWEELSKAPHIFLIQTAEDKRSRDPMGRPIVPKEMALLFDAANSRHMLSYLMIATNTLARPGAVLELRGVQYDDTHDRVDLNPPGRRQNKKHRPILAVTPTLKPWLQTVTDPTQHYVAYGRQPIKSITTAWELLVKEAGLDERVTPYSIRHGMAREMRKRKVPKEQISAFLGHLPKDSDATTSIYAPYDPEYCSEAVAAIESVMSEIRKHLKRATIDQPMIDAAKLAKSISSKAKRGVGDAKREEVRFLILSGLPHKEVVKRSKVSSGTVSLIRKEMRAVIPLYRNSESGLCVPFACREDAGSDSRDDQVPEFIGGPARTRTWDLTVMSGQL
jgi:hypothetical protein